MREHTVQYGAARVLNVWLAGGCVFLFLVAMASVGANIWTVTHIESQRPLVVRLDHLGRPDVVTYDAAGNLNANQLTDFYRFTLAEFVTQHFGRRRSTIQQDYARSLYFMGSALADRAIALNEQEQIVGGFIAAAGADEVAIEVRQVRLRNLTELPFRADVDFDKVFIPHGGWRERKRETHTAQIAFSVLDTVPPEFVRVNPLGLQIVDLVVEQALADPRVALVKE